MTENRSYIGLGSVGDERHELREDRALEEQQFDAVAVLHNALGETAAVINLVDRLAHGIEHFQNRVAMFAVNSLQFSHYPVLK